MPARRWVRRSGDDQAAAAPSENLGDSTASEADTSKTLLPTGAAAADSATSSVLSRMSLCSACKARELLPGFVHLPGLLPLPAQQALLDMACHVALGRQGDSASGGWYRREAGKAPALNDGTKARFWDTSSIFPAEFRALGEAVAQRADKEFPGNLGEHAACFEARVGALNFYTGRGKMNWHCDDYNFAKKDRPIVMASLGDTAEFGYKMHASEPDRSVKLESGDVIVFGGRARDLIHAMLRVYEGTAPQQLVVPAQPGKGRISVTWRDAGPEDGLTFNSDERLGLVVTSNTLPRYLPGRSPKGKGKGKYRGYG
eukprot:gb/GFBE01081509.1/.p1 GENE.gb/GFBE01081509.1/~~gb/GFBE01081509.1/.p1  ORF type:complete len:314 (+),score=42.13 gb/GFBE01081509.1/:1-942(+)